MASAIKTRFLDDQCPIRQTSVFRVSSHKRMLALDGLRGLAIVAVLTLHFFSMGSESHLLAAMPLLGPWLVKIALSGWLGVDLFFVLSGFLIAGILFDSKFSPNYFRNFYVRRGLRIFPLYYGTLIVVLGSSAFLHGPAAADAHHILVSQWRLWLYWNNMPPFLPLAFWNCTSFGLSHFWSLAVEEHFYVFFPLIVFVLHRRALILFSCLCVFAGFSVRLLMLRAHIHGTTLATFSPARIDALGMGAMVALIRRGPRGLKPLRNLAKLVSVVTGIVMLLFVFNPRSRPLPFLFSGLGIQFSVAALFFAAIITLVLISEEQSGLLAWALSLMPLRIAGKYSYGLYVLHFVLLPQIARIASTDALVSFTGSHLAGVVLFMFIAGSISFTAAFLSWHLFEKQILKLKRFFDYRPVVGVIT